MSTRAVTYCTQTCDVDEGFDTYIVDATNGNVTLTLPNITTDGIYFSFNRVDSSGHTVTVEGNSSQQTIDGNATKSFASGEKDAMVSINNVWISVI